MDRHDINFDDFCDLMLEKVNNLREKNGVSAIIRLEDITKRNNQKKKAIYLESGDRKISPVIYMDEVFDRYDYFTSFDALAKDLYNLLFEDNDVENNVFNMLSHEGIKQNVTYRLINKQMNDAFLKDKVYRDFLDLAVTYQIVVCVNDNDGYITLTKALVERIGLSEEELFEMAMKNTPKLFPAVNLSLIEAIGGQIPDGFSDEWNNVHDECFRVITNDNKKFGASVLLYPGIVEKLYAQYGSKYVIPSSLHEVLLVDFNANPDNYLSMVKSVNDEVVEKEDILSNSLYQITADGLSIALSVA